MILIDFGITIPFLLALFFWSRGAWRRAAGDLALAAVVFGVGVAGYVYFYSYTRLSGLPWIAAGIAGCVAGAVAVKQRFMGEKSTAIVMLVVLPLCLSAALFLAERRFIATSNSLLVIAPYRCAGTWVFDDPLTGLKAEPFVAGIPELIDKLIAEANIPDADKGFRLIFSRQPFPGFQTKVVWRRTEAGGNWYYSEKYNAEGWLCPALFKYMKRAPREIYVKAEKK